MSSLLPTVQDSAPASGVSAVPDGHGTAGDLTVTDVTVVIPTRNEAENVVELLRRLDDALGQLSAEILFVDDSDDDTPAAIRTAALQTPRHVRLLHRVAAEREGGLGGAVVAGFRRARSPWAVVIDGDLQHPPEVIPDLLRRGWAGGLDLVIGSRYSAAGDATGLSGRWRVSASALCTRLAKMAFPRRLHAITDPMSGFFAVRLSALRLDQLRPLGYKVLLEVIARSALRRTADVPYSFQPRYAGTSKASIQQGLRFFQHLLLLRLSSAANRVRRPWKFLAVGASGVAVNTAVLWLLSTSWLHVPYLVASALGTQAAIAWNFTLMERIVFSDSRAHSTIHRFARFWLLNVVLLPIQLLLLALFVERLGLQPVSANVVVLTLVFAARYTITAGWVYSSRGATAAQATSAALLSPQGPGVMRLRDTASESQSFSEPPRATSAGSHLTPVLHRRKWVRTRYAGRLALPLALTTMSFPNWPVTLWRNSEVGRGSVALAAVLALEVLLLAFFATAPAPGEPNVHDRQLDVILGAPLIAAAMWLSLGWGTLPPPAVPLNNRLVLAVTAFLIGATIICLGTRLAARLRWVLLLPLLGMPMLPDYPTFTGALVTGVPAAIVMQVVLKERAHRLVPQGGGPRSAWHQTLPRLRISPAAVAAVAFYLGVTSFAS
jgi:putative flippase GtrA